MSMRIVGLLVAVTYVFLGACVALLMYDRATYKQRQQYECPLPGHESSYSRSPMPDEYRFAVEWETNWAVLNGCCGAYPGR
mgnify:CR=1 FL=1